MLTFTENIDKALELGSKSYFASKAQQKDALDYLNRAYECVKKTMVHKGSTPQERWLEAYDLPNNLCHIKEKHRSIMQHLSMDCDVVFKLVKIRNIFKNYEVIKLSKKNHQLKTLMVLINHTVTKAIKNSNEVEVDLKHYFGKDLWKRVSHTWHFVTNSQGTKFIRVFWFLDGKFTKLSKILSLRG